MSVSCSPSSALARSAFMTVITRLLVLVAILGLLKGGYATPVSIPSIIPPHYPSFPHLNRSQPSRTQHLSTQCTTRPFESRPPHPSSAVHTCAPPVPKWLSVRRGRRHDKHSCRARPHAWQYARRGERVGRGQRAYVAVQVTSGVRLNYNHKEVVLHL